MEIFSFYFYAHVSIMSSFLCCCFQLLTKELCPSEMCITHKELIFVIPLSLCKCHWCASRASYYSLLLLLWEIPSGTSTLNDPITIWRNACLASSRGKFRLISWSASMLPHIWVFFFKDFWLIRAFWDGAPCWWVGARVQYRQHTTFCCNVQFKVNKVHFLQLCFCFK